MFAPNALLPRAVFAEPVVTASRALAPTAVLLAPLVAAPKAAFPIAVLFSPLTESSKALSPRTVLPETEFAPLPILTEFIVPSTANAGPPVKVNKLMNAFPDVLFICIIPDVVLAKN